jgi:hypothetical protein
MCQARIEEEEERQRMATSALEATKDFFQLLSGNFGADEEEEDKEEEDTNRNDLDGGSQDDNQDQINVGQEMSHEHLQKL